MEKQWAVTRRDWAWRPAPTADDNSIEIRGMAWDLSCPVGHRLRAYTSFASFVDPLNVGCEKCGRSYPALFKSN